jgi:hypothetical protein
MPGGSLSRARSVPAYLRSGRSRETRVARYLSFAPPCTDIDMAPNDVRCDICQYMFSSRGFGRHRAACEKRNADQRADMESTAATRRRLNRDHHGIRLI